MKYAFYAVCWLTLVACQTRRSADETKTENQQTTTKVCYAYLSDADTIRLSMTRTGNLVSGSLYYQLSGKDRNNGTLAGRMYGDTLLADYTFQSEGVESIREVAFLVNHDKLTEGFGPVQEQNGKMTFLPRTKVTFTSSMPLTKAVCAD